MTTHESDVKALELGKALLDLLANLDSKVVFNHYSDSVNVSVTVKRQDGDPRNPRSPQNLREQSLWIEGLENNPPPSWEAEVISFLQGEVNLIREIKEEQPNDKR